jgi:hypothetical protein
VVAAVMDFHRGLVDVRFQGVGSVREIGKFVCHSDLESLIVFKLVPEEGIEPPTKGL